MQSWPVVTLAQRVGVELRLTEILMPIRCVRRRSCVAWYSGRTWLIVPMAIDAWGRKTPATTPIFLLILRLKLETLRPLIPGPPAVVSELTHFET